jgi:hypothetical protein
VSYQENSLLVEQHQEWKGEAEYSNGFAIITGKVWRGKTRVVFSQHWMRMRCVSAATSILQKDQIMVERR